jgi:hypothetical protein
MKTSTKSILHLPMIERIKIRLNRGRDRVALAHQAGIQASSAAASLIDANAPTSTRIRAADSVLTHSAKTIESEDIEAPMSAVKASVAPNQKGVGR